jgi:AraC-like DNA-binding protein
MKYRGNFMDNLSCVLDQSYAITTLSISQMAAQMGISERQLQRRVMALTGRTPKQYLRRYRLEQALVYLRDGVPVGEAAKAAGFSSHAYFTSCFKAKFGATPSRFQQGCR